MSKLTIEEVMLTVKALEEEINKLKTRVFSLEISLQLLAHAILEATDSIVTFEEVLEEDEH